MSRIANRPDWADDEDFDDPSVLPPQQITSNKDGTKTIISYRFNDDNKKVKTTRKIRTTVVKEHVNPRVAERKTWPKFGLEKGHAPGPDLQTTSVGENIVFRPSINWKATQKEDQSGSKGSMKEQLKDKKVKCRICNGEHFTARCPFKDTMAPADEVAAGTGDQDGSDRGTPEPAGGLGESKSRYIAPHLRHGAGGSGGDRMGGKFERDDLATLRVTNVSEFAEEGDLRDMFARFGHVTRVFLAKDRDTGRAKGFAFISFADRADAAKACEKMDGYGFGHLILRVEFAKRSA
ncbi:MAG: translation initiation factor eIF3 subunit g [Geoglossum umbratile]|nr:MAG: translation initiation factor eIF3 subunit g [Geoglossum umbratile]